MRNWYVACFLTCLGLGCGGEVRERTDGGTEPHDDTAREIYDRDVQPLIAKCAPCHAGADGGTVGPNFLGTQSGANYHDVLLASGKVDLVTPAQSQILTKGAHSTAPVYSAGEKATITGWLSKEAEEMGGGPDAAPDSDAGP